MRGQQESNNSILYGRTPPRGDGHKDRQMTTEKHTYERLRIKAALLQKEDILIPTNRTIKRKVFSVQNRKVNLTFTSGKKASFNKDTIVTINRKKS